MSDTKIANPGSREALALGCACPVIDNARGKGISDADGKPMFWKNKDCPLHGTNYFILQGGAEHFDYFEHNVRYENAGVEFFWTCPRAARKGDVGFVYLCAPQSRIVGRVELVGEPFHNTGNMFRNPIMKDKYCVQIGNVEYFPYRPELTMKGLRELFALDWAWLRYPRGNTRIPADIIQPFMELIENGRDTKYGRNTNY